MTLLILQLLCCSLMTGLIWVIQILHYPAFLFVHEDQFQKFHAQHSRNITFIVGPIMLIELITAFMLVLRFSNSWALYTNSILLILIWGCTFFLSVPLHTELSKSRDIKVIDRLILTNWIRTILWSARLMVLFWYTLTVFVYSSIDSKINF